MNIYQKRNLVFYVFNNHENIFDKQSIYINYYIRNKFLYKDLYKAILESQSILYEHMNILYFNKGNIYYQIKKSNIIYIESYRNSIVIHTQLTQYTLRCPLKNIQHKLGIKFIQCHKSFIINTDYISSIKENNIILNNGYIIPIGQKYKHSLTKHDKE